MREFAFCECLVEKEFFESFILQDSKILNSIDNGSVFTVLLSMFLCRKCLSNSLGNSLTN